MKFNWQSFKRKLFGAEPQSSVGELDPDMLKEMARSIATTRPDEIGCAECFEQMDQFVDMALTGKDAAQAMPLVQDHLDRCGDCREEFEALLAAVRAVG
jgi:bacterioferritin-associated ferredoxin